MAHEQPTFIQGQPQFDGFTDQQMATHLRWLAEQFNFTARHMAERRIEVGMTLGRLEMPVGRPVAPEIAIQKLSKVL